MSRVFKGDVVRAFERHLEVLAELGIDTSRADLEVSHPGDRHGTRYRPVNVPTLPNRTWCGAREAFDAITGATFAVQATAREVRPAHV